ncbi:MAG: tRNA(fMet)-specific endonuclease VapC [Candidatus Bathyarchaeota archaeon BA2]|nr:MAG: tRNA(fMet)-specific endonuclease VapC [Candidatus Bathyarchaeota archaeon BA2]
MIFIDSMIWIYNCDAKAPEHKNVCRWLEGEKDRKGIIDLEELFVNTVVVMEVVHNLRRRAQLPSDLVYGYVLSMLTLRNMTVAPLDRELLHISMHTFEKYYKYGIGGRDATILATMLKWNIESIATHDQKLLKITHFRRVDPAHHPPRILEKGKPYNSKTS